MSIFTNLFTYNICTTRCFKNLFSLSSPTGPDWYQIYLFSMCTASVIKHWELCWLWLVKALFDSLQQNVAGSCTEKTLKSLYLFHIQEYINWLEFWSVTGEKVAIHRSFCQSWGKLPSTATWASLGESCPTPCWLQGMLN